MNCIKIDLERILSDIDRNIFGGYMEIGYLDTKFEYLDVGHSTRGDKEGLRSDVQAALERMKLANIRFPGGNFSSGYRWIDGVGPSEERPTRHDLAWNCIVSNQYGTNEFMQLCRKLNVDPYLCANCGDGNMREAADWVEYCNGTGNTALANLRRKHGFVEPHKVKYWGIGNEVDGPWQIGYKTPQEYARALTEFSKVMKRTDPNIKLLASAVSLWEDQPPFPENPAEIAPRIRREEIEWVERTQLILEQAGDLLDYLAIHRYAHPFDNEPVENFMAFAADFDQRLKAYEGLIHAVSIERGIKHNISIAVDEWGVMHLSNTRDESLPFNNLEDALILAMYFNAFIRHSFSVRMANCTSMPTSIEIRPMGPDNLVLLQTIFYPFELYSRTCGPLALDVFWYGDTFSGRYLNRTYTGVRTLDVAATLDEARKQLVVYVVNQSKNEAMETTISLVSGEFAGIVQVSVINGPDIKAENTEKTPNQVVTRKSNLKVSGQSFTYTFEPHSVTAMVCAVH